MSRTIEELLNTPYWIIDILPKQVPAGGAGQYFAVEKYLSKSFPNFCTIVFEQISMRIFKCQLIS